MAIYAYCSIIASVILYANIVSTLKKVKNNESTDLNTVIGCFCIAFITYSIFIFCGR